LISSIEDPLVPAIKNKKCAVKLSMKVVESDKEKLFRDYQSTQKSSPADKASPQQPDSTLDSLPPVLYAHESENEGWTTFDKPLVYV
jgi:sphingosine kinase